MHYIWPPWRDGTTPKEYWFENRHVSKARFHKPLCNTTDIVYTSQLFSHGNRVLGRWYEEVGGGGSWHQSSASSPGFAGNSLVITEAATTDGLPLVVNRMSPQKRALPSRLHVCYTLYYSPTCSDIYRIYWYILIYRDIYIFIYIHKFTYIYENKIASKQRYNL